MKQCVSIFILLTMFPCIVAAQEPRPRNPFDTDILAETFGYGPDTTSLVDYRELYQGCPARDCIPSIDKPVYVPAGAADFLSEDDLVMAVIVGGNKRAYPTRIMDHHEIVNDTIGGTPIVITWCPLCGSGLAFERFVDGRPVEFGVAGVLHGSDLVMYDRATNTLWQQITGEAIMGPRMGDRLEIVPLIMTEWRTWRLAHPDTLVLSTDTGFDRDYADRSRYDKYDESDRIAFPVSGRDLSIHPKTVVYGFEIDGRKLAVLEESLKHNTVIETRLGDLELTVRRHADGSVTATDPSGNSHTAIRLFWFAWYNFHPDTERI